MTKQELIEEVAKMLVAQATGYGGLWNEIDETQKDPFRINATEILDFIWEYYCVNKWWQSVTKEDKK